MRGVAINPPGETPDVGIPPHLAGSMTIAEQQEWLRRYLDRHRVSRRRAVRNGANVLTALAATTAPWALASCARAARTPVGVIGRHLSFGDDPTRQMAVAAELTTKPAGPVLVDIGHDARYGRTVEAEVRALLSMVPQQDGSIRAAEQYFVHALADDLSPGGTFHYRVRLADDTTTPDAVFTCAPDRRGLQPFTFTAFADQGVSIDPTGPARTATTDEPGHATTPQDALVEQIARRRPAFHLLAGDICYADPSGHGRPVKNNSTGSPDNGFDNFDPTVWTQYFGAIEKSAMSVPWLFATGNHDMEALYDDNTAPGGAAHGYAGHAARLDLPRTGPAGCPSVYSVVYGNVGILSLDANDLSQEIPTNAGYSAGAQLRWLTRRLTELRADPHVDFIVAFFHHCAYATSSAHASDGGVRAALAPLFDRFSVDLVVQGHNHQYERTNPIRGGRSTVQATDGATVDSARNGTTYVCCGSGGHSSYAWQPDETDRYRHSVGAAADAATSADSGTEVTSFVAGLDAARTPEAVDWSQARYRGYAFLTVHVTPAAPGATTTMSVRAVTDRGSEIDRVDITRTAGSTTRPTPAESPSAWQTHRPTGLSVPGSATT
jgi:Calcineurin-like phosphoesterase